VSKEIKGNDLNICYENNKIYRKIIIINDTNDFGFPIFLNNTENKTNYYMEDVTS
jgi:hypothetical protein